MKHTHTITSAELCSGSEARSSAWGKIMQRVSLASAPAELRLGLHMTGNTPEPGPFQTNPGEAAPSGGDDDADWDDFWQQRKRRPLGRLLAWGRRRFVTPALVKLLEKNTEPGVLGEAGCGSGEVTLRLARRRGDRVILVDTSRRALSLALSNARRLGVGATSLECDVRHLREHLPAGEVTHVHNIGVIEHFHDPSDILKQMASVSSRWALVVVPERGVFWHVFIALARLLKLAPRDMYVYLHNKRTLSQAVQKIGLEPLGFCRARILGFIPYLGIRFRIPLTEQNDAPHAADV